jgi:hypothetical protein
MILLAASVYSSSVPATAPLSDASGLWKVAIRASLVNQECLRIDLKDHLNFHKALYLQADCNQSGTQKRPDPVKDHGR